MTRKKRKQSTRATDKERGLYRKYIIERVDGSSAPGRKHHDCDCFVLDLTHDPFAIPAIKAYIEACRAEYPLLAADLEKRIAKPRCQQCGGKGGWETGPHSGNCPACKGTGEERTK